MRRILLLFLLATCPAFQGCLGTLIGAALSPRSTAASMGSQVAYNVSRNLAGVDLSEVVTQADTLANLESILKEHPDAANRAELERLRNRLAEDLKAPVDDASLPDEVLAMRDGHQLGPPEPVGRPAYDRRSGDGGGRDPFAHAIAGRPQGRPAGMQSSLELERPDQPEQRLRSRDPWRFASVPPATELQRAERGWSIITLGGAAQHRDGRRGH